MKNLFVKKLLLAAVLAFAACSSNGYKAGDYRGFLTIVTLAKNSGHPAKDSEPARVVAQVERSFFGSGTIEFPDTGDVKNCRLELGRFGEKPSFASGQTCEIKFDGAFERFTITEIKLDYQTKYEPTIRVDATGVNNDGSGKEHYAQIHFIGGLAEKTKDGEK